MSASRGTLFPVGPTITAIEFAGVGLLSLGSGDRLVGGTCLLIGLAIVAGSALLRAANLGFQGKGCAS